MKAHECLFCWSQHDVAHDAFMTLPPHTSSKENDVRPVVEGARTEEQMARAHAHMTAPPAPSSPIHVLVDLNRCQASAQRCFFTTSVFKSIVVGVLISVCQLFASADEMWASTREKVTLT